MNTHEILKGCGLELEHTDSIACPFCGSEKSTISKIGDNLYRFLCEACSATGPVKASQEQAFEAWNKRL